MLLLVSIVGVIAAPALILVYAGGFAAQGGDRYALAVEMFRWVFPYVFFISLTSLYAGVLNSYQRFALPAFTQVIQNVLLIVVAIFFATAQQPAGRGAGDRRVHLRRCCRCCRCSRRWRAWACCRGRAGGRRAEGVRRILKLMVPGIIGSSMSQLSLLLNSAISSFLAVGSISALYLADRLMEFPLGVFSIALGTVILPSLSAQHAKQDGQQFSDTLDWALRLTVLLVAPAMIGMIFFAGPDGRRSVRLPQGRRGRHPGHPDGQLRAGGVFLGRDDLQPHQGAGAGLLRAPGHEGAGARGADRAGRERRLQRRRGGAGGAAGLRVAVPAAGHVHLPRRPR